IAREQLAEGEIDESELGLLAALDAAQQRQPQFRLPQQPAAAHARRPVAVHRRHHFKRVLIIIIIITLLLMGDGHCEGAARQGAAYGCQVHFFYSKHTHLHYRRHYESAPPNAIITITSNYMVTVITKTSQRCSCEYGAAVDG